MANASEIDCCGFDFSAEWYISVVNREGIAPSMCFSFSSSVAQSARMLDACSLTSKSICKDSKTKLQIC